MGTSPTASAMAVTWATDSSIDIRTFRRLYSGEADTVTDSPSTPASMASCAPRRLGTSATYDTSGRPCTPAITSAAPAIAGTAEGDTKATASSSRRPAATRASTSATRSSTPTGDSAWRPSRGPTSRLRTTEGRTAELIRGSYGRDPVVSLREPPPLGPGLRQPRRQLVTQPLGLDDGVHHQVRRQSQEIDVGLVLGAALGHEGRPLGGILDGGDPVGVHGVDRGL